MMMDWTAYELRLKRTPEFVLRRIFCDGERKEKGQQDFMRLWERMRTLRVTFKALVDGLNRIG